MDIKITIDDNSVNNFVGDAESTLKKQLEQYARDVIKEANLIEEGLHEDEAAKEITSSYILQAARKSRTVKPPKKHKYLPLAKIVSFVSSFLAGVLFDLEAMQGDKWRIIITFVVFIVATISTLFQFIWED